MKRHLKRYFDIVFFALAPGFLKRAVKRRGEKRYLKQISERMKRTRISKEEVDSVFDEMQLGCDVMFHTSTMNIGKVAGGTKFLAERIEKTVDTSKHTLLLSALPYSFPHVDTVFDVRTAPVAVGAVNEYFALMDGAKRSLHPTHSVVAIGPRADEYVSAHHLDETPFGQNSPYRKLIENNGKIVMFGATMDNITELHAVEDMVGPLYPVKIYTETYDVKVVDYDGRELTVKTPLHLQSASIRRNPWKLREGLLECGAMSARKLGEGEVLVIDMRRMVFFCLNMLLGGESLYGRHKVSAELREKLNELIVSLKNTK